MDDLIGWLINWLGCAVMSNVDWLMLEGCTCIQTNSITSVCRLFNRWAAWLVGWYGGVVGGETGGVGWWVD